MVRAGGLVHQRQAFGLDGETPFIAAVAAGDESFGPVIPPPREFLSYLLHN
jgi:hypothetical protein